MTEDTERSRDRSWLGWGIVLAVTLLFTTLKTVRPPINYPATMSLLNYDQGFIKRGLFGSVFFAGDGPVSHAQMTILALAMLGALLAVLWGVAVLMLRQRPELGPLALLFACSISVVYFASTTGYFDHLLVIMAVVAILPATAVIRAVLTLCLGLLALLIHEAAALMVLPLMYFALFLAVRPQGLRPALVVCGSIMAVHAALTLYLSFFGVLDDTSLALLRETLEQRAAFPLSDLGFHVISVTPVDDMARVLDNRGLRDHLLSLLIVLPALAPILCVAAVGVRHLALTHRGAVWCFWGAACLAPCVLRFVGTDIHRWDSLAVCTSFLALFVVQRDLPASYRFPLDRGWFLPALMLMIIISASTTTFLFWEQQIRWYPFFDL
jgi:hypothetical protein